MLKSLLDWLRHLFRPPPGRETPYLPEAFTIPVLVVQFFPVRAGCIDRAVTGDVDAPLETIRRHCAHTTVEVVQALEAGSTYLGYKNAAAQACLRYRIVDTLEYLEPLPTCNKAGHEHPMTDYNAIMERIGIQRWVEERGVSEVWLWGYHGGVIDIWESNMAGPFGDVSNSDRDVNDLPVLGKTYTVYHYNYQRGTSEAVEDHVHQIEAVLREVNHDLFWNRYVGRPGAWRCGWAHYPPNAERGYDWANRRYIWSDIEDWKPDGPGERKRINCTRWHCAGLGWFVFWMRNVPGPNNGLAYRGRPLTNWWAFIGDYDGAMTAGLDLVS